MAFSVDGRFLFCCGDRQVKVFHNITGYKAKISDFTNQLKTCDKNSERRLNDQLQEARYVNTHDFMLEYIFCDFLLIALRYHSCHFRCEA